MSKVSAWAACAAVILMAGGAAAADLPISYAAPLPTFTWTGAYFGVNLGGAVGFASHGTVAGLLPANDGVTTGARPGTVGLDDSGMSVGGQVGYDFQFANTGFVLGAEADLAYTDLGTTDTYGEGAAVSTFRSGQDYLGTVRGRLGYAFGRLLVYGTGGLAYGDVYDKDLLYAPNGSLRFAGSRDGTQTGYAVGGGVEYALRKAPFFNVLGSSAVTIRAEYLYYDLGSGTVAATSPVNPNIGGYSTRYRIDGNLVRVGLNYKF